MAIKMFLGSVVIQIVLCPIRGIEQYLDVARQMQIDLTRGYLFRPTTPKGSVQDSPLTSSTAEARLKHYLTQMGANDGETLHGFRAGCAITLALTGADLSEIIQHVGWARRHTALYYMQLAKVLNPEGASARLASSAASADLVAPLWDANHLQRFVLAFPPNNVNPGVLTL